MRSALLAAAALTLACQPPHQHPRAATSRAGVQLAADLVIRRASVFDGERALGVVDVAIDRGRIVAIGPDLAIAGTARVVDGSGRTLLPGLIDAHAHVRDESALEAALTFGVTTVLDLMGTAESAQRLRAASAASPARADLRAATNPVVAPGGVGTQYGIPYATVEDPEQIEAFVDARIADGADFVKLVADDLTGLGVATPWPTLAPETLQRAIARAHHHGKLAIVHVTRLADAVAAIDAGADGLAHLFADAPADASLAARARERGVFVITTLAALHTLAGAPVGAQLAADPDLAPFLSAGAVTGLRTVLPARVAEATLLRVEHAAASLRAFRDAGVDLLVGTDSPNPGTAHGASVHHELALLVAAGLTPEEALRAATATPARRFGLDDRGRVAERMRADLVLVDGDPLTDITATRRIVEVWRGGEALDREARRATPAAPPPSGQTP
jgi:imidazolonepropionase-like amidohydrolase